MTRDSDYIYLTVLDFSIISQICSKMALGLSTSDFIKRLDDLYLTRRYKFHENDSTPLKLYIPFLCEQKKNYEFTDSVAILQGELFSCVQDPNS